MAQEKYFGDERRQHERSWHLDKKFAISVIGAMLLQAATFGWYAGQEVADRRVDHANIADIMAWREKQDDERSKIESRLATVDQELKDQSDLLRRIADTLENKSYRK